MKPMLTVCDHVRARADGATTRFDAALRYYGSLDRTPTTMRFGDLVSTAERVGRVLRRYAPMSSSHDTVPCCGITLEDGSDVFVCQLAAMFAGLAVLPLNARDPTKRLASVFSDADVRVVVARDAAEVCAMREVSGDVKVWLVDEIFAMEPSSDSQTVIPMPDDVAHVFFTSGSTGRPKGCVATHAALLAYCEAKNMAHEIDDSSVVLCASSHLFDPHMTDFCSSMVAGATLASASRELTLTRLGELLKVSSASHCLTTPVLLSSVSHVEPLRCGHLRMVALGGEAMSKSLAQRWIDIGVRIVNTYGVTECVAYQSFKEIFDPSSEDLREIGDALPGNELIFAREPGDDPNVAAQPGELAELWIGGKQVCRGYLNRQDLTASRFKSGMYRTGDIVKVCDDGRHILAGRRDDQVKISGQRVELGEIEDAIRRTCGLIVRENKCVLNKSNQLVAYCTGELEGVDVVASEVCRFAVSKEVPRHMIPSAFVFVDEFPTTSTGKISRSALIDRDIDVPVGNCAVGFGTFGQNLAKIWSEELGVDVMYGDCHFITMGGDSLAALRVVLRVKTLIYGTDKESGGAFGESLGTFAPAELLQRPVLNDYARFIRINCENWPEKYNSDSEEVDIGNEPSDSDVGLNLLFSVAAAGHEAWVRVLVAAGAPVDPKSGLTPLHIACANARLDCIRTLIQLGASVNALGTNRRTPLLFAVASTACSAAIVNVLLESGANANAVDADKQTALHIAARVGTSSAVTVSILEGISSKSKSSSKKKLGDSKRPDVNALDAWGRTALHWAAVNGHRNACKELLDRGADGSIRDRDGETARDIAERRALCSAQERPKGGRPSTWGDIANLLGGSGATKHLKKAAFASH